MKEISCKHCNRYLFTQAGTVVIEKLICPNSKCKAHLNFKYIQADTIKDINHKFITPEQAPKKEVKENG